MNRRASLLWAGFGLVLAVALMGLGLWAFTRWGSVSSRTARLRVWLNDSASHPEWAIQSGQPCGTAPFLMPTSGLVGFLWDDSFRPGHRHAGIDIFGGRGLNETPVVAAYSGYLTRLPDWKSSVIVRIPSDPLVPNQQIWTYYTHMASPEGEPYISEQFPPGTQEMFIEAGTLLGYQGNFSGTPGNPTGIHLHFSVVRDEGGKFLNELEIENTLDPSPYLGLPLNRQTNSDQVPVCPSAP